MTPDAGIGGADGGMPPLPPPVTPEGCAYRYSTSPSMYLSLCTNSGGTNVNVNRYAGEAVYWSSGIGRSMISDGVNTIESTWSYNETGGYSDGTPINLSGTCSMDLQIRDNGTLYRANPTMQLYGSTYDFTSPWSCYEYSSPPDYYQRSCSESVYRYTSAYGYAYSY